MLQHAKPDPAPHLSKSTGTYLPWVDAIVHGAPEFRETGTGVVDNMEGKGENPHREGGPDCVAKDEVDGGEIINIHRVPVRTHQRL